MLNSGAQHHFTYPLPNQSDKIIGVLGGLGPAATVDFCNRLIRLTPAEIEQDHLHVVVDNNPKAPNRNEAIAGNGPSPAQSFANSAKRLNQAGVDFIVMPCNTAHAFQSAITENINVPFVSIISETVNVIADHCKDKAHGKIALLAADGCMGAGLYQQQLDTIGVETLCLDEAEQFAFMQTVYAIKHQGVTPQTKDQMQRFADILIASGADSLIAGCTEVPLVLAADDVSVPLFDSTEILATQCVAYAKNQIPLPEQN